MKAKQVKNQLRITQPTLSSYVKQGLIRVTKINPYHYEYNEDDVLKLLGLKKKRKKTICVSYSRVSTFDQKQQLKEQSRRLYEFCTAKGLDLQKQYEDIKSGMNVETREGFFTLLDEVVQGNIGVIVIENKDRLIRFGFELLERFFKYFGATILVVNDTVQNKSYEQELTEDLVAIIHYFSMKMYSHRRKLNKLKKELLQQ